jgi:hypothetical protein
MDDRFADFSRAFHAHFTADPNERVRKGVDRALGELPDPSLEAARGRRGEANRLLAKLDEIPLEDADFDTRLDADLARLMLEREVHELEYRFNGKTRLEQMPCAGDEIGDGIFLLFIADPRPAAERLADITARLEAVPDYLRALRGRLDTPLARWRTMDVEKVEGLSDLFVSVSRWAGEIGWEGISRLEAARPRAEAALDAYAKALQELPTTAQIHVGEQVARRIVSLRGIDKSFAELHRIAADFLAETREIVEELRGRLVRKYRLPSATGTAELETHLRERYRLPLKNGDLDGILRRYEAEREHVLAFIREHELFPILEQQDMRILRTPPFMAPSIPAGAMMPPPPFREGVRRSLIYLTLSEELRDEHTEISIPSMMIHEGIPGHHLQLATASTHASVIRRHIEASEQAEGWTTMLEDYMLDVGYRGEVADEIRFCGKRDLNRIGARVAIDLFFMTGDKSYLEVGIDCDLSSEDPFVAAGNLLAEVTGFVPGRVQAELNWYSQERGYPLSYLTGNRMVWEIKEQLARSQAGKLEGLALDRRFHELYLGSGNMPLTFFRRVLTEQGLLPRA